MITFDDAYYDNLMKKFGYDPLNFGRIDFSLGKMSSEDLQRKWLCHNDANVFSKAQSSGQKVIVSTGFGLSGVPHAGTLSQILRSISLQRAGLDVQMVLGDLDAYNGKAKPLNETLELVDRYKTFVRGLGFSEGGNSVLRSQFEALDVLRTSYLIGHYMEDELFSKAEEDLHELYHQHDKVDADMSYRRKLSLNLMTADFMNLFMEKGFSNVLVMLGIDEHQYVRFSQETAQRMKDDYGEFHIAGLYSSIISGFNGFPKMSKSFPDSGITVNMEAETISNRIMEGEGVSDSPETNVVYQMMAAISNYTPSELEDAYNSCVVGGKQWQTAKKNYVGMLVDICEAWV